MRWRTGPIRGRAAAYLKSAELLVPVARDAAVASYTHVLKEFPVLENVGFDDWHFFATVAWLYASLEPLKYAPIHESVRHRITWVVRKAAASWDAQALEALDDCKALVERWTSVAKQAAADEFRIPDALGYWVVANVLRRIPGEAELKIARPVGTILVDTSLPWWGIFGAL